MLRRARPFRYRFSQRRAADPGEGYRRAPSHPGAGLVGAKRGPRGGYHLARPAYEIRLGDVVRALEGPIAITGGGDPPKRPLVDGKDVTDAVLRELSRRIEGCFDDVSIADMCRRGSELGLRKLSERYVYVI
jgi:Rrf2 family transcriptional regulator, iron-sulfur cluster assembly transcription factor